MLFFDTANYHAQGQAFEIKNKTKWTIFSRKILRIEAEQRKLSDSKTYRTQQDTVRLRILEHSVFQGSVSLFHYKRHITQSHQLSVVHCLATHCYGGLMMRAGR